MTTPGIACSLFVSHRRALPRSTVTIFSLQLLLGWAQSWTCGGGVCTTTGNVGIGTATPTATLQLTTPAPSGTVYPTVILGAAGSTTNGRWLGPVTNGGEQFYLAKNLYYNPTSGWNSDNAAGNAGLLAFDGSAYPYPVGVYVAPAGSTTRSLIASMLFDTAGNVLMVNGKLGIGTYHPQYLLSVNGTIGSKEVIVTNTGWSDYVFQPGYRLAPLNEVSSYITEHHHLPDIPSETEVRERGVSVGEMQAKLLAKIEELTLHMIHADEKNELLEQQNQELRQRVTRLERAH